VHLDVPLQEEEMSMSASSERALSGSRVEISGDPAISSLERHTVRRVAYHLLPFLMLCYGIAYLVRVNLSFAALTMNKVLGLTATEYGTGAGLFFLTYCVCEIPSNLLLYRFGASRWIARIMFSLGICAGAMAFIRGETSFYGARLLLGAAEAGFYPGVLFFLTQWFPSSYRARIMGLFIAAIPISGIIGAPLSGLLMSLDGVAGLQGWQWLFLIEATPALLLTPFVTRLLQDDPAQAKWLPDEERTWLVGQLAQERSQVESKRRYSILECLINGRVLFLAAIYFSNVCLLNSITFFMPQIVKGFGMSTARTGFVMAIPSVIALIALIAWGRSSDRRKERYGHAALANLVGGLALLLSVLINDPTARIAALAVAFAGTLAFTSPFWSIPGSFLTGGAAAGGIGVISALGVTGGFLSPWFIGVIKDATGDFRIGLGAIALLAIAVGGALLVYAGAELRRSAAIPSRAQGETLP
jgi:MFS family permease